MVRAWPEMTSHTAPPKPAKIMRMLKRNNQARSDIFLRYFTANLAVCRRSRDAAVRADLPPSRFCVQELRLRLPPPARPSPNDRCVLRIGRHGGRESP